MRKFATACLAMLLLGAWASDAVFGGPIEDAQKLIQEKKFGQVDAALDKLLTQKAPPKEALELSLQAAVADGRYVTAYQRANALLDAAGGKDLALVYQAATLAAQAAEYRDALGKYLYYVQNQPKATPELRQAMHYLLREGAHPDVLQKYIALYGPTDAAWSLGTATLDRLLDGLGGDQSRRVAALLIETFPAPARVHHVHRRLADAAGTAALGRSPEERYVATLRVMAKGRPSDYEALWRVYQAADDTLPKPELIALLLEIQQVAAAPLPDYLVGQFALLKDVAPDAAKLDLAKKFLAHEKLYADSKDRGDYYRFVSVITENAPVFHVEGQELVSDADIQKKFDALKAKYADSPRTLQPRLRSIQTAYLKDAPVRIAFLARHPDAMSTDDLRDWVQLTEGKELDKQLAAVSKGQHFGTVLSYRVAVMDWYNRLAQDAYKAVADARTKADNAQARFDTAQKAAKSDKAGDKEKNALAEAQKALQGAGAELKAAEAAFAPLAKKLGEPLLATARDYLTCYPDSFDRNRLRSDFMYSPLLDMPVRLGLLKDAIAKAGLSKAMKDLLNELNGDRKNFGGTKDFEALQAFAKTAKGSDPLLVLCVEAHESWDAAKHRKKAPEDVAKILAQAKGTLFAGDGPKDAPEWVLYRIYSRHRGVMWNDRDGFYAMAETWAPRMGLGADWEGTARRVRELGNSGLLYTLAKHYVQQVQAAKSAGDERVWQELASARNPKEDPQSVFAPVYDRMGWERALAYLYNQASNDRDNQQKWADEIGVLMGTKGFAFSSSAGAYSWLSNLYNLAASDRKLSPKSAEAIWAFYLADADRTKDYSVWSEGLVYGMLRRSGHGEAAQKFYEAYLGNLVSKRPARAQIESCSVIAYHDGPAREAAGQYESGKRNHMLFQLLPPLLEQVAQEGFAGVTLHQQLFDTARWYATTGDEGWKGMNAQGMQLCRTLAEALAAGASYSGAPHHRVYALEVAAADAARQADWASLATLIPSYARHLPDHGDWDYNLRSRIEPLCSTLEQARASEMAFAFITALDRMHAVPDKARKQMAVVKSRAARAITGLIAVRTDDPTYDLHMAAQALSFGNEVRAWELTEAKIGMLPKAWESLDPDYVAWCIEQLAAQKRLKEALDLAMTVLLREQDLPDELAARLLLAKGNIYRAMENFQAAKLEYQSLRSNPRYSKTQAGQRALYSMIDLFVTMADYGAADEILERLVDHEDVRVQAEAYYLYAKMSFLQEEYKEAYEYVRKVFDRVPDHVEAAFLEGELHLRLPGGLQHTEVRIGQARLRTILVPGRVLTMKLRDTNLAIARGGAAVPVVVRTSVGKDEEHVKLLPSSADKYEFTASITTSLGQPAPGNMNLEILGEDVISYRIDPEYQKANEINYPPKNLEVKADGSLAVSSGEILSREEQEQRALERKMAAAQAQETSRRFDVLRSGTTVRPGSPVYVQVLDPDRDVSMGKDKVTVRIATSSGDVIESFELTETEPHSAMFRAQVPTGIPLPKASASDTAEGLDPSVLINSTRKESWSSLSDGKKPKSIEVDTMSSHEMQQVSIKMTSPGQVRSVALLGMLAGDYEELAAFPERSEQQKGGLTVASAYNVNAGSVDDMRKQIALRGGKARWQEAAAFDRSATDYKDRQGWMVSQMSGVFWLPEDQAVEFKFVQPLSPHNWQHAFLLIDGQMYLGGNMTKDTIGWTRRVFLAKGAHRLEVLVADQHAKSQAVVGYMKDDGTFAPLPAEWFSVAANPGLAEYLKPKGKITMTDDGFTAVLAEPTRLRKVQWVFEDFTGNAVEASEIAILDSHGRPVVPVEKDFTAGRTNDSLEIAPGDTITVTYVDEKRVSVGSPELTSTLKASYYNGEIELAYEDIDERTKQSIFHPAKRFRVGDQLMIRVVDYDLDLTDERDVVEIEVTTGSGERLVLKALETGQHGQHNHAGTFMAVLRTGEQTGGDQIKVRQDDIIKVAYLDKENTAPGVPIQREYEVMEAGQATPRPLVYRTSVTQEKDTSDEAARKAERIKQKLALPEDPVVFKDVVIATHPEYSPQGKSAAPAPQPAGTPEDPIRCSVIAPILFEVNYPTLALHAGSHWAATAVAQSELDAAREENREARIVAVPLSIGTADGLARAKGYDVRVQSHFRADAESMLSAGTFAGVIRLQMGSPGDEVDDVIVTTDGLVPRTEDELKKIATLVVCGSDVVHVTVEDAITKERHTRSIRLLSDGRLELLDPSYTIVKNAIHLGEKFFVQVTDPDSDVSDARDELTVVARSGVGDQLTLTLSETLPHSGVFTGSFEPVYVGEKKERLDPKDDVLSVGFGDQVTFTYVDRISLASDAERTVEGTGSIFFGANAEVAVFTKLFTDPEMAVKTRFLMAEALFEVAKEHRKLGKEDLASEELAQGKRILEEALADYPNTTLASQGEYLLANLAQELANFDEAIARYANVITTWGASEYASRSQLQKAICYESLENYDAACEEYVKLTYIYPESPLVANAVVRLGNYYYKRGRYDTAGEVFFKFQDRNPQHKLASRALFLSGQCFYKMNDFKTAAERFALLVETYPDDREIRPEAMYWLGESYFNARNYQFAYQSFKKLTWDYPEDKWAKIARGRLTERAFSEME